MLDTFGPYVLPYCTALSMGFWPPVLWSCSDSIIIKVRNLFNGELYFTGYQLCGNCVLTFQNDVFYYNERSKIMQKDSGKSIPIPGFLISLQVM